MVGSPAHRDRYLIQLVAWPDGGIQFLRYGHQRGPTLPAKGPLLTGLHAPLLGIDNACKAISKADRILVILREVEQAKPLGGQLHHGQKREGQDRHGHEDLEQGESAVHESTRLVLTRPVSGPTVMMYARRPAASIRKLPPLEPPWGMKVIGRSSVGDSRCSKDDSCRRVSPPETASRPTRRTRSVRRSASNATSWA